MKLKKALAFVLAGTMVVSMASVLTAGAASDEDNKLTVWTWDPNFNIYAINKAAEIYAKDHEGFTIEVTEIQSDDIESKITTAVNAGDLSTLPDIFLMQDPALISHSSPQRRLHILLLMKRITVFRLITVLL